MVGTAHARLCPPYKTWIVIARSQRVRPSAGPMINSATKQSILRYAVPWIAWRSLSSGARRQACDDKVDHLVDRRPRLEGALRNHLRMEEPHHRRAGTHRRQRQVGDLKFAGRGTLGDDGADGLGYSLHVSHANVPALLHRDLDHLVQLRIADVAFGIHAMDGCHHLAQ